MSRVSLIKRPGTANNGLKPTRPHDEFPPLKIDEIVDCLQSCDFLASEELVSKPTSQYIRMLFEQILDAFMGFSPEYCVSTTRSILQKSSDLDVDNSQEDQVAHDETANTTHLLVLFRAADTFLQQCGLYDLRFTDLMRPEPLRTLRILSAVINYAKFREVHLNECEPLVRICEGNMEEVRRAEDSNNKLTNDIAILKDNLGEDAKHESGHLRSTLEQLNSFNSRLEQELRALQKSQEEVRSEHKKYRDEKNRLIRKLEDKEFHIGELSRELEKLTKYAETDFAFNEIIGNDLKSNLTELETLFRETEESLRRKTKTVNSIQLIEDELRNLMKIVQEITNDLKRLEDTRLNYETQNGQLEQKKKYAEELQIQLQRMQRKCTMSEEKIIKLRQQIEERELAAKKSLEQIDARYAQVLIERDAQEKELDEHKKEISKLEQLMAKKTNDFEHDRRTLEALSAKLIAQIRLYLSGMSHEL